MPSYYNQEQKTQNLSYNQEIGLVKEFCGRCLYGQQSGGCILETKNLEALNAREEFSQCFESEDCIKSTLGERK